MVIRKSVAILAAVVLAVVPCGVLYMTQIYPNGSGAEIDTSVHVGGDTSVFWNGNDKTGWVTGAERYDTLTFEEISTMETAQPFNPPRLGLAAAPVNPETMRDGAITPETQVAVFWQVGHESYSRGQNGKQLTRLSFDGLADEELLALTPNGVVVQIKDTGVPRVLTVSLKDSRGVETTEQFTFYETVNL